MSLIADLQGRECSCIFELPHNEWPIAGTPAWVRVIDVDLPMVKLESVHGGSAVWVNAACIRSLRRTA